MNKQNLVLGLSVGAVSLVLSACLSVQNSDSSSNPQQAQIERSTDSGTVARGQFTKAEDVAVPIVASLLPDYRTRSIEDEVFYFVMPDRFDNGDTNNDMGSTSIALSRGGFDPSNPKAYHGGDLAGIINNLDYIERMGITAIWLTPILRNQAQQGDISGYHGYWVLDFTEIDPHLGTNAELKAFIDAAHAKNIKVFFDIITNHTADVIKMVECHGEEGRGWSESGSRCPYKTIAQVASGDGYTAIVPKGSENAKTPAWLNDPQYYHNQGDFTSDPEASIHGDFAGLDDLNTQHPRVVQGLTEIFKDIITEFRPDGFRIDTVKHVHLSFWQSFIPAIEAHAKNIGIDNFFMFGEVWEYDPAKLARFTTEGKLPSVLDFAFQGAIYQTLIEDKGTEAFAALFAQDVLYSDPYQLLTFTGNHDMGRFAYLLKDKRPELLETEVTERIKLAHAMLFLLRGVPVIYYGDEQGFVGDGNDILSRQNMFESQVAVYNDDDLIATDLSTADRNFDQSHPFYAYFRDLSQLHLSFSALRNGKQAIIETSDTPGVLSFTRKNDEQLLRIVINTSSQPITTAFDAARERVVYPANNNALSPHAIDPFDFVIFQVTK